MKKIILEWAFVTDTIKNLGSKEKVRDSDLSSDFSDHLLKIDLTKVS